MIIPIPIFIESPEERERNKQKQAEKKAEAARHDKAANRAQVEVDQWVFLNHPHCLGGVMRHKGTGEQVELPECFGGQFIARAEDKAKIWKAEKYHELLTQYLKEETEE